MLNTTSVMYGISALYVAPSGLDMFCDRFTGLHPVLVYTALSGLKLPNEFKFIFKVFCVLPAYSVLSVRDIFSLATKWRHISVLVYTTISGLKLPYEFKFIFQGILRPACIFCLIGSGHIFFSHEVATYIIAGVYRLSGLKLPYEFKFIFKVFFVLPAYSVLSVRDIFSLATKWRHISAKGEALRNYTMGLTLKGRHTYVTC